MAYQVHRLGRGEVDRGRIRQLRRVMNSSANPVLARMSEDLSTLAREDNHTLRHFRDHLIKSFAIGSHTAPTDDPTDVFLKSMSGLDMTPDMRTSRGAAGVLYHPDMESVTSVLPWMYQMDLMSMRTMLASVMFSLGVRPRSPQSLQRALADSWMGTPEHSQMLSDLSELLVLPIMALANRTAGGPPSDYVEDVGFLSRMGEDQVPDHHVGMMFIADMAFNHL